MRNIDRRLDHLARQFGCPQHGEMLSCPACHARELMPDVPQVGVDHFIDGLLARLSPEAILEASGRVKPPTSAPCQRCGELSVCGTCLAHYAKALFQAIGLTVSEETALQGLAYLADTLEAAAERDGYEKY